MKYDELIKDLRICASTFTQPCEECSHTEAGDCYNKLKRNAADAIEELRGVIQRQREMINATAYLPLYPKPMKWIPVEERLPEVGKTVLFSYRGCIQKQQRIFIGWYNGKQWDSLFATEYDVTHWMPLPEPPKDDSKDIPIEYFESGGK